ncbi:MFS transporter [Neobacillus sp. YIM B06451]|uniref:MFS transporter n=1 Tax=Neobacillus sp. YIM B06451 TaxID=3070994 RepID=UPI002930AA85|nr:MFS transporter [Neobacillus sp. YIM B06451]
MKYPASKSVLQSSIIFERGMKMKQAELASSTNSAPDQKTIRKVVISGAIGNFIEWYDLAIYSYAAIGISMVLFSEAGEFALLYSLLAFGFTYLLRPISGVIMGAIGDRIGRKKLLVLTISMMAIGTLCIGLIPSYAAIGIGAPILLMACRAVQGISAGGEFVGAAAYVYEFSNRKNKVFLMGLIQLGTCLCYPAAAFAAYGLGIWLGGDAFNEWGWRLLFISAAPLGLIALFIRSGLDESPVFKKLQENGEISASPLKDSLKYDPKRLILTSLYVLGYNAAAVMVLLYMPIYLVNVSGFAPTEANLTMGITGLIFGLSVPVFAWIVGRNPDNIPAFRIASCAVFAVFVVFAYWLFTVPGGMIFGIVILGLIVGFHYALAPFTVVDVFPAAHRFTSGAIAYNVPVAIGGALFPVLFTSLSKMGALTPPIFVALVNVVACICAIGLARITKERDSTTYVPSTSYNSLSKEMSKL